MSLCFFLFFIYLIIYLFINILFLFCVQPDSWRCSGCDFDCCLHCMKMAGTVKPGDREMHPTHRHPLVFARDVNRRCNLCRASLVHLFCVCAYFLYYFIILLFCCYLFVCFDLISLCVQTVAWQCTACGYDLCHRCMSNKQQVCSIMLLLVSARFLFAFFFFMFSFSCVRWRWASTRARTAASSAARTRAGIAAACASPSCCAPPSAPNTEH